MTVPDPWCPVKAVCDMAFLMNEIYEKDKGRI